MNLTNNSRKRKSIRLNNFDYGQASSYFITLCAQNRQHLFGEIKNGIMGLNYIGNILSNEWQKTESIRKNISLGPFIIMPNHFHAIIQIDYKIATNISTGEFKSPSHTIGAIIRGFKGSVTKKVKQELYNTSINHLIDLNKSIWHRNYYEHIIRNFNDYKNISTYIINNPSNWEKDKLFKKQKS